MNNLLEKAEGDFVERTFEGDDINVASFRAATQVHGPGERFALWTQECLKRCPGCINGHMLKSEVANLMPQKTLLDFVRRSRDGVLAVEGITIMGGEPMLQAKGLAILLEAIKAETPDFNTLIFTGYTLEELQRFNRQSINDLLALTDTLIDGTYERTQRDAGHIRGSKNQNVHHLTERLAERDFSRKGDEHSVNLTSQGVYHGQTGIPINQFA